MPTTEASSDHSPRLNGRNGAAPEDEGPQEEAPNLLQIGKTFSAFGVPAYRFLWLSMITSFAGMQMQMVARGYLAYDIGGTASSLALVSLGWGLPMLFLSLIGGAIADRIERRSLMIYSQLGTALVALGTAVLVHSGWIELWHLFASSLIQGTIFAFAFPARMAYIPEVVGEKELQNAIALNSAGFNLTGIVGPSLGGAFIAISWFNVQGVFYLQALLNIVALVLLLFIPVRAAIEAKISPGGRQGETQSVLSDLVAGLRYVTRSPILGTLMLMVLIPSLIGMSYMNFLPVFSEDVFGDGEGNPTGLGLMMTMTGVGALIGSLAVAATQAYPRKTLVQLISGIGFGAGLAFFAVQGNFVAALAGLAVLGFCSNCFMTLNNALLMSASDSQYYGRVMSLNIMAFALMPLGTLPVGILADAIGYLDVGPVSLHGIQVTQLGAGLLLVGFILLIVILNRGYGRLRQSDFKQFAQVASERVADRPLPEPAGLRVGGPSI